MSKITDWAAVISNPAFWASYYVSHIDVQEEEDDFEVLDEIFGCDFAAVEMLSKKLMGFDEDPAGMVEGADWNVLTIPFPAGYTWQIEFNTVPGIYHYLTHPEFPERLRLGYDDPHCMLPILRRAEIAPLAAAARRHGKVEFDPRALYLLFYPLATLTQADDLDAARRELTQAWTDFGLLAPEKVALLVERVTWVGETMNAAFRSVPIEWWRDEALGWITNANHSYRNPDNRWEPAEFARWNTFLTRMVNYAEG